MPQDMPLPFAPLMREGERLDALLRGDLHILQRPDGFRFGMDSVLLAAFAAERTAKGLAIDLGTGSGILPLLVHARRPDIRFDAVEIQPEMADMAARSMRLNGLEDALRVHRMDLLDAPRLLGHERYRLAVCNPPYGPRGGAMQNPDAARRAARHEGEADIEAICRVAGALLQNGGRLAMVYPAPRLLALMDAYRAARIEPKHVRLVHPFPDAAPNLALVEGIKAARPSLHFLPPLFVRGKSGEETEAIRRIYEE